MAKLIIHIFILMMVSSTASRPMQTGYRIRNSVVINNEKDVLTKLVIIMPLPQANQYQIVSNVKVNGGDIVDIPETDDKYLRWTLTGDIPSRGSSKEIYYDFDVKPLAIDFDFSKITNVYPYDTTANTYKWYTGASSVYADPDNALIQQIGDSIGLKSSGSVDYARRCYIFVAEHFSYLNPYTGIHPLKEILEAGGGDCGNLTSIYVSLLRHKKIPSRHIVTIRPDGSYHVWCDFYMEKYGWIPVDVTFKNSDPSGDYFGKYDGNGIVMTKEVGLQIDRGDGSTYNADLLQNYHWWYWCSTNGNTVTSYHHVSSSVTSVVNRLEITPDRRSYCQSNGAVNLIKWYNLTGQVLKRTSLKSEAVFIGQDRLAGNRKIVNVINR